MKHRGSRSGAGPVPALLVLGVLLLAVTVTAVLLRPGRDEGAAGPTASPPAPSSSPAASPGPTLAAPAGQGAAAELRKAVDTVLRERNQVVSGEAVAVPSTARALRDVTPALRRSQARLLRNLAVVPFTSWRLSRAGGHAPTAQGGRAHLTVTLRDRLPGDVAAQRTTVRTTWVHRHGRWLLAGWHPHRPQLWDVGPVHVVRRGPVLVLGPQGSRRLAVVAAATRQALGGVAATWPYAWSRKVTVIVPGDRTDMAALLDLPQRDLAGLGAVTTSEATAVPVRGAVRVTVNPAYVWGLSPLARRILLRHELTHVAQYGLGPQRLRGVPTWLSEGVAEYVGYRGQGVPFDVVASDLLDEVRQGRQPALPSDATFDFAQAAQGRTLAYRAGWTFCVFLAERAGGDAPYRLYREVATARGGERARVASAVRRVLDQPLSEVVRDWHAWLRGQA